MLSSLFLPLCKHEETTTQGRANARRGPPYELIHQKINVTTESTVATTIFQETISILLTPSRPSSTKLLSPLKTLICSTALDHGRMTRSLLGKKTSHHKQYTNQTKLCYILNYALRLKGQNKINRVLSFNRRMWVK